MAVQRVAAQARALRLHINMRYNGYDFKADHRLTAWAIRHAAWLETRFQPKGDGHSAFYRTRGVEYKSPIYEFGECVICRDPVDELIKSKLKSRWFPGVFLGRADLSDECLIGSPHGVTRVRTLRRSPKSNPFVLTEP